MSIINDSWRSISSEIASKYLKGFGNPAESSKDLLLSLLRAERCNKIIIRFFEPPVFDVDCVELRVIDLGKGDVPYLRRKMSKNYYSMILAK